MTVSGLLEHGALEAGAFLHVAERYRVFGAGAEEFRQRTDGGELEKPGDRQLPAEPFAQSGVDLRQQQRNMAEAIVGAARMIQLRRAAKKNIRPL